MSLDLSLLNPLQLEAVTAPDAHTLITAGPGTGKTSTIAYRIAYLISECGVKPENILAMTFTRKAAQEMRERILKISTRNSRLATHDFQLNIGTFHSLGLAILREKGHQAGLLPDFRVITEPEQTELVKEILPHLIPQEPLVRAKKWVQRISEQKNFYFNTQIGGTFALDVPEVLFSSYEKRLKELNAIDFDDLVLKPLLLFREFPQAQASYQNRFLYILVDEYQDINNAQYQFLKCLGGPNVNLWVIGDGDQAIYAFRGANLEHFLRFQQDHPGTRVIQLEKNYRSSPAILTGARAVIALNSNRILCNLTSSNPGAPHIYLFSASEDRDEARFVVKEIENLVGGVRMESSFEDSEIFGFSEIAVLYRLHHLSHHFSEALKQSGIPYQVIGKTSAHLGSPLADLLSCLKVISDPYDDLSLRTVFSLIGDRFNSPALSRLIRSAQEAGCSFYAFLQTPKIAELLDHLPVDPVSRLFSFLQQFRKASQTLDLEQLIRNICQDLKLNNETDDGIPSEWSPLIEPFREGPACQQLPRFLEHISLMKEGETYDPEAEAVTLMTAHAAKGLEFPVVFMVALESGIFPCTEFGEEPADLEEERRLFYVGMTRAKKKLYLSYSQSRYLFGKNRKNISSQFISEIPREVVETIPDFGQSKALKKPRIKQRSLFS